MLIQATFVITLGNHMQLNRFLRQHQIKIDPDSRKAFEAGLKIMSQSPDVNHDAGHVALILKELDQMLQHQPELLDELDFDVLLPAIAWHDTWKAQVGQPESLIGFLWLKIHDGSGSRKLFLSYAKGAGLDESRIPQIAYAIDKHDRAYSRIFILLERWFRPVRTLEAKVLRDIDTIAGMHPSNFERLIEHYLKQEETLLSPGLLKVASWWFQKVVMKDTEDIFFFDYAQQEFGERKRYIIDRAQELWEQREHWIDWPDEPWWRRVFSFVRRD